MVFYAQGDRTLSMKPWGQSVLCDMHLNGAIIPKLKKSRRKRANSDVRIQLHVNMNLVLSERKTPV